MKHLIFAIALMFACHMAAQTNRATAQRKPAAAATAKKTTATKPAAAQNTTAQKHAARTQATAAKRPVYKEITYKIKGKAHGFAENEWIKLCDPSPKGFVAYDSVQLNGEDFEFEGKTMNIPHMQYLVIGEGVKKTLVEVFLEQGVINVDITAEKRIDSVSGTTHNNIYTPYRDSINAIYTDLYECIKESVSMKNSQEDREAYKAGADQLRAKIIATTYDFARKNLNNWVGVYLFAEYHKRFTPQQNKALLAKLPQKYASLPITDMIRKFVKTQK